MPFIDKKIIVTLIIAFIIVGGSFYIKNKPASLVIQKNSNGLIAQNSVSDAENFLQNDADNDGLRYWEEALWHTNSDNPDTDGDGTPDGEEVKNGRDPTVPGPNDKLKTITAPEGADVATTTGTKSSLTDTLARSLYANYSVLQQSGNLTPENQDKLLETLSGSVEQILEPKVYTKDDIKIAPTENHDSIKKYGNDVALVLYNNLKVIREKNINEAISLTNYLNKKDPAELQKVVDSANSYKNSVNELLQVEAPLSSIIQHLTLINSLGYFGQAVEGMSMVDNDPVVALVSLQNYQKGAGKIVDALRGLVSYFGNKKIIFTDKDYGYVFSKGI